MADNKLQLRSEAFHHSFALSEKGGRVLAGWEAEELSKDKFQIKRADDSTRKISLGESLGNAGTVEKESTGVLRVGEFIIPIGSNFNHDWYAKKTKRTDEYILIKKEGGSVRTKLGENLRDHGKVELLPTGHLKVGSKQVAVHQLEFSLNLLVMQTEESRGYSAWINTKIPEQQDLNGIKGIFYPQKGKQPARFCETDEQGNLYITAKFWVTQDNSKSFVRAQLRDKNTAIKEKIAYNKLKEITEMAAETGAQKEMIPGYDELKKELDSYNKQEWETRIFHVACGLEDFGIKPKEREPVPEPSM